MLYLICGIYSPKPSSKRPCEEGHSPHLSRKLTKKQKEADQKNKDKQKVKGRGLWLGNIQDGLSLMSEQSYKNTCFWSKDVDLLLVFKKIKTVSCNYYFTAGIFEQYSVLILKLPCCVKLPNSHNNQAEASLSFLTPVILYYCYLQKNNLFDILETLRSLVRLKICFNFCCQGQIWYCLKMIYLQILTKIDGFCYRQKNSGKRTHEESDGSKNKEDKPLTTKKLKQIKKHLHGKGLFPKSMFY